MRLRLTRFVVIMILMLSSMLCLTSCNGNKSISGTWVVKEYIINENTVTKDDIATQMGDLFATYNDSKIIFSSHDTVEATLPTGNPSATYTVDDNTIVIYAENGKPAAYLMLDDENIDMEISENIHIIFAKE